MEAEVSVGAFWIAFGIIGAIIFYSRFYVQWIASELAKKSVMPIIFWYMSSVGSVMLLIFAFASQSPLGALGQSFNIVVYSRNLIHIWREHGKLTPALSRTVHVLAFGVGFISVGLMLSTWWREYQISADRTASVAQQAWIWLAVGVVGQALFAGRFALQLLATEMKGKSVIPNAFWYLSIVAASLQVASFVQRAEWIFAVGAGASILIYVRNVWFVHNREDEAQAE